MKRYYSKRLVHGKPRDYWFSADFETFKELSKNGNCFEVNWDERTIFDKKINQYVSEIILASGEIFNFKKQFWSNNFGEPILKLDISNGIIYTHNLDCYQDINGVMTDGSSAPICIKCKKQMNGKKIGGKNTIYSYHCDCGKKTEVAFGTGY